MNFAEALTWMKESVKNVAVRLPVHSYESCTQYRIEGNILQYRSHADQSWSISQINSNDLISANWEKSEPVPEEVEVVAYVSKTGSIDIVEVGSEDQEYISRLDEWRKVKVRFT